MNTQVKYIFQESKQRWKSDCRTYIQISKYQCTGKVTVFFFKNIFKMFNDSTIRDP